MRDDSSETTVEMPISNRVQERINELISVGFSDEGFLSLRTNKDLYDEFETFVNFCLVHLVTSMDWRYNACNNVISDIFSVTDEAFCILLLENNLVDYKKAAEEKRKISRKESQPRYTQGGISMSNIKGWDRKGIKRFNKLVQGIQRNRSTETSKEMEMQLKDHYMDMCGKKNSPSGAESDDSDDNESDPEELEAYDGFAGTVEETPVIDVTQSQKRQRTNNDAGTVEETPVIDVTQTQKRLRTNNDARMVEETPVIDVTQTQKPQRTDNDSFVSATDLISVARSIVQV